MGAKRTYEKQITVTIPSDAIESMENVEWAVAKNAGLIPVKYTNDLTGGDEWRLLRDKSGYGVSTKFGIWRYHGYLGSYDNVKMFAYGFRRVKSYRHWDTERGEFYRVTLGRDIMATED